MATFEVQVGGKTFDVDAPDAETAARAAAQVAAGRQPPTPIRRSDENTGNPVMDFIGKVGNRAIDRANATESRQFDRRVSPVPLLQPGADAINPGKGAAAAWGQYRANSLDRLQNPSRHGLFEGPVDMAKAIGATVAAPFAGLTNQVIGPMARGLEKAGLGDEQGNAEVFNTALMGAKPGPRGPVAPPPPRLPVGAPARTLAQKLPPVAEMRQEAAVQRAAGVQPTLTDVSGSKGQRFVRAVGGKNDAAGEILEKRATQARANTKPAAINQTRALTPDPRTPSQVAADTRQARQIAAQTDYAPAYAEQVALEPETAQALSSQTGQTALRLALRGARDLPDGEAVTAEIQSVLDAAGKSDGALPKTLSGRTLDYVYQTLGDIGRGNLQNPRLGRQAAGAFNRQGQVQQSLDAAPGLKPARQAYRQSSQAIDVAEGKNVPDPFTTDPGDYARWLQSLPPQARAANEVGVRQYLQDWLGGQRQGPLGSLDEIASSPYGTANLRTVFGDRAGHFIDNIDALVRQQRAAQAAAPSGGSRTAILENDMQGAQNVVNGLQIGANVIGGRPLAAVSGVLDWARRMGINDQLATEIAQLSSDPARLDEALNLIEAAKGPAARQQLQALLSHVGQGAQMALPVAGAAGASQPGSP